MNRRHEIDAVRGVLLLVMTMTHLPTRLHAYADQPLGYVSAAEGFVFLSAFLTGSIHAPALAERGAAWVRRNVWRRARYLYGFHLGLLLFVFAVLGTLAHVTHSAGLHNYLRFFFESPGWALVSAPLLLYQPPLLDILPMYIVFLLLTPLLLQLAQRRGWWPLLSASAVIWLAAQFGSSALLYGGLRRLGLPLPPDAWGAFDWLAWQMIWTAGLWMGARSGTRSRAALPGCSRLRACLLPAATAVAACLLVSRHHFWGSQVQIEIASTLVDKWRLGPLRVVNFAAVGVLVHRWVLPLMRVLRVGTLELLGRSSLQVFTAHIPACLIANALVDLGIVMPTLTHQGALLVATLALMLLVASRSNGAWRRRAEGPAAGLALQAGSCSRIRWQNVAASRTSSGSSSCPMA